MLKALLFFSITTVDNHYSPTMQHTKQREEFLTAGKMNYLIVDGGETEKPGGLVKQFCL